MHIYEYSVASSCVSPHSGKLSTRNAPQPNTDPGALDVAAEFAKFVAKAASELSILPTFLNHAPPPPPPPPPKKPKTKKTKYINFKHDKKK